MLMNLIINDTTGKTSLMTGKRTGEGINFGDDARRDIKEVTETINGRTSREDDNRVMQGAGVVN